MRPLPLIVLAMVVGVFAVGAWLHLRTPDPAENAAVGNMAINVDIGGPFTLTDHTGTTFTDEDLHGTYALIFFGFTYCPDVCPTELGRIALALDLLDEAGAEVTPVMITVDPERDTPAVLAEYVPLFHERMIGLTGTPAAIREVAERYRVFYRKVEDPNFSHYLVDHSAFTYLADPQGEVISMFRHGTQAEEIAATVRRAMAR